MERPIGGHQEDVRVAANARHGLPSLAALYQEHADFVWRTVLRLGVAEAHAEDAVHEVFLVVRRKLPEFRGDASPRTWLYAIARGVCANLRRTHSRAQRRDELAPTPEPGESPEDALAREGAARIVEEFIACLPAAQREVFVLVEIEEMTGPEVAAATQAPLGSVYSRLRLARKRFDAVVKERNRDV